MHRDSTCHLRRQVSGLLDGRSCPISSRSISSFLERRRASQTSRTRDTLTHGPRYSTYATNLANIKNLFHISSPVECVSKKSHPNNSTTGPTVFDGWGSPRDSILATQGQLYSVSHANRFKQQLRAGLAETQMFQNSIEVGMEVRQARMVEQSHMLGSGSRCYLQLNVVHIVLIQASEVCQYMHKQCRH